MNFASLRSPKGMATALLPPTQEPTEQPYGIDAGFRDPSGNHMRVAQMR